jgi:hypothetical protein
MTAYLQPGDIVHLSMPELKPGQLESIKNFYASYGVDVFLATGIDSPHASFDVVSVIRTEKPPRPAPPDPDWKLE